MSFVLLAAAWLIVAYVLPFVALWVGALAGEPAVCPVGRDLLHFRRRACHANGQPRVLGILFPVGMLLFVMIQLRTMVLNIVQGGIRWRETFYPLEDLRKNVV